MAKKARNETEIEARYKAGESPREIAKDYRNTTGDNISKMAYRNGWKREKDKIREEHVGSAIETQKSTLEELCSLTEQIHFEFIGKLKAKRDDGTTMMDDIQNPFLFEGERVNSLFQTVLNNATKILLAKLKYEESHQTNNAVQTLQAILKIQDQTNASS